jgi:hypothetical protein
MVAAFPFYIAFLSLNKIAGKCSPFLYRDSKTLLLAIDSSPIKTKIVNIEYKTISK